MPNRATLIVTDSQICMVRGDDVELQVQLYDDAEGREPHEMIAGETLTLTVRRDPKGGDDAPVIQIVSEEDTIKIPASATAGLPYGAYSADVEFYSAALGHITIWPHRAAYEMARFGAMKNFVIGTEVT